MPGRNGWRRLSAGDGTYDHPPVFDIAVALLLSIGLLSEVVLAAVQDRSPVLVHPVVGVLLALVITVPLAWRRVVPLLTMATSGIATGVFTLLGHDFGFVGLTLMVALYSIAAYGTRHDAQVSLGVTAGFVVTGFGAAAARAGEADLGPLLGTSLVLAAVWILGDRTRGRRQLVAQLQVRAEEAERHQALAAELASADERRRIARELHDVVAHAVSVVVVQASAGRRVADRDPAAAAQVLATIEDSGRQALGELRRLVTVLRDDTPTSGSNDPQPTLQEVPALVHRLAEAGVPVVLERTGNLTEVPPGVAVSAYRIVQESLTNVLKHAGAVSWVKVSLDAGGSELHISVTDDGAGVNPPRAPRGDADTVPVMGPPGPGTAAPAAAGTGLLGMRERTMLLGGSLRAGPRLEGGFAVDATLPLLPPVDVPLASPVSPTPGRDVVEVE